MATDQKIRVRFAPSPTGFLHIGGLRTALYNYLFARRWGGTFILRIEDTDRTRTVPGGAEGIIRTLRRAGLDYDEGPDVEGQERGKYGPYVQSKRLTIYREHIYKLVTAGAAYQCFCSPEELETVRQIQIAAKQPTIYNKKCREMSSPDRAALIKDGRPHVIRLAIPEEGSTTFSDIIRKEITFENRLIDDSVLLKSDGYPTYHLASVVDDHLMNISQVIRGEEWIPSTPKHVILYRAFGWTPPEFAHLPLLLNPDRSKLSKRQMDVAVENYLDRGYLPEALINFTALLGWNPQADREVYELDELARSFNLPDVNSSGAVVNLEKLGWLNGQHLRRLSKEEYARRAVPYLEAASLITPCPGGWVNEQSGTIFSSQDLQNALSLERERVRNLGDLPEALSFIFGAVPEYDGDLLIWKDAEPARIMKGLGELAEFLELMRDWTESALEARIKAWIDEQGYDTGQILWPMRVALTGRKASPGPFEVAAVLGKERTLARLRKAVEKLS